MGDHYWYDISVLSVFLGLHAGTENHCWYDISIFSVFLQVYTHKKNLQAVHKSTVLQLHLTLRIDSLHCFQDFMPLLTEMRQHPSILQS